MTYLFIYELTMYVVKFYANIWVQIATLKNLNDSYAKSVYIKILYFIT